MAFLLYVLVYDDWVHFSVEILSYNSNIHMAFLLHVISSGEGDDWPDMISYCNMDIDVAFLQNVSLGECRIDLL